MSTGSGSMFPGHKLDGQRNLFFSVLFENIFCLAAAALFLSFPDKISQWRFPFYHFLPKVTSKFHSVQVLRGVGRVLGPGVDPLLLTRARAQRSLCASMPRGVHQVFGPRSHRVSLNSLACRLLLHLLRGWVREDFQVFPHVCPVGHQKNCWGPSWPTHHITISQQLLHPPGPGEFFCGQNLETEA